MPGTFQRRWPPRANNVRRASPAQLLSFPGSLDTFETFDIEPRSGWLKLVIGVEELLGLAMITASVWWLVLLYPALSRNRSFAELDD